MSEKDEPMINITSHNQSGGITAHTVHIGKPQYELTDEDIAAVLKATPRDRPVEVLSVGSNRAHEMGRRLVEALRGAGHGLGRIREFSHWSPVPDSPLSVDVRDEFTRVTVAPSA